MFGADIFHEHRRAMCSLGGGLYATGNSPGGSVVVLLLAISTSETEISRRDLIHNP